MGANGRLPKGITIGGGFDIGRQVDDHCLTVDMPNQPNDITGNPLRGGSLAPAANSYNPFCRVVTDWKNLADLRLRGSVPLPWNFNASFIYRNTPGRARGRHAGGDLGHGAVQGPDAHGPDHRADREPVCAELGLRRPLLTARRRRQQVVRHRLGPAAGRARRLQRAELQHGPVRPRRLQHGTNCSATGVRCWQRPTGFLDARLARLTASINF